MARQATGSPKYDPRGKVWRGRVTAPNGQRVRVVLGDWPNTPAGEQAAKTEAERLRVELRARELEAVPRAEVGAPREGCAGWLDAWIADRQRRGFTSTPENRSHYETHIVPVLGSKHVRDWTAEDLRKLSRELDVKVQAGSLSWKSACNIWGTATKMCRDASTSKLDALRVRTDNPAIGVLGPDRGARTVKQYLYPSEFLRFVSCERVPIEWRRAVAVAAYSFPRASELRVLRWEDVDLEHGTVHVHRSRDRNTGAEKPTKTAIARRFAIEPSLLPLLRALHAETGGCGLVVELPSERDMARGFRRWLAKAGVDRAELHTSSRTRKSITFHDLRATGLTWLAVRGDDPLKIMQRAGHTDFKTTQGYIREAEAVREGFGDVFPALPTSLLTADSKPTRSGNGSGGKLASGHAARPSVGAAHRDHRGETIAHPIDQPTIDHALTCSKVIEPITPDDRDRAILSQIVHVEAGSSPVRPARKRREVAQEIEIQISRDMLRDIDPPS